MAASLFLFLFERYDCQELIHKIIAYVGHTPTMLLVATADRQTLLEIKQCPYETQEMQGILAQLYHQTLDQVKADKEEEASHEAEEDILKDMDTQDQEREYYTYNWGVEVDSDSS